MNNPNSPSSGSDKAGATTLTKGQAVTIRGQQSQGQRFVYWATEGNDVLVVPQQEYAKLDSGAAHSNQTPNGIQRFPMDAISPATT